MTSMRSGGTRAALTLLVTLVVLLAGGAAQSATSFTVSSVPMPGSPTTMTVDSRAHRGYVALSDQPVVVVMNTRTTKVLGTIEVGRVTALAVDPRLHRLYAAQDDDTLAVIDTRSRAVLRRVDIRVTAFRLAVDTRTHRVLALSDDQYVTAVDPDASTDPTMIPLTALPTDIAIESAQHRAYVAVSDGVTVIDTRTNTVLGTARLDAAPFALALDGPRRRLFVVSRQDHVVRVVDTVSGALLAGFTDPDPDAAGTIAVDPGSHLGYITHQGFPSEGRVTAFDTTSYAVLGQVEAGRVFQVAVDTGTHKAFLPFFRTLSVSVITPQ